MCVHVVFTRTCVFTCVHAYMATVASYLLFILSYNATVVVTLFFPYSASAAAHQGAEDEVAEDVESNTIASY